MQTPPDESVFDVKKDNTVAVASLGYKILHNWPAVGWIEGQVMKRNVDLRMKIGSDSQIVCFLQV